MSSPNSTAPSLGVGLPPPILLQPVRFGEEAIRRYRTAEQKLQDAETRRYECEHCAETFAKQAALNEHLKSHNQTPVQQTEQLSVKMARWRNAA